MTTSDACCVNVRRAAAAYAQPLVAQVRFAGCEFLALGRPPLLLGHRYHWLPGLGITARKVEDRDLRTLPEIDGYSRKELCAANDAIIATHIYLSRNHARRCVAEAARGYEGVAKRKCTLMRAASTHWPAALVRTCVDVVRERQPTPAQRGARRLFVRHALAPIVSIEERLIGEFDLARLADTFEASISHEKLLECRQAAHTHATKRRCV